MFFCKAPSGAEGRSEATTVGEVGGRCKVFYRKNVNMSLLDWKKTCLLFDFEIGIDFANEVVLVDCNVVRFDVRA